MCPLGKPFVLGVRAALVVKGCLILLDSELAPSWPGGSAAGKETGVLSRAAGAAVQDFSSLLLLFTDASCVPPTDVCASGPYSPLRSLKIAPMAEGCAEHGQNISGPSAVRMCTPYLLFSYFL